MLVRSQLPLAVGHADVSFHMAFHRSAAYFHDEFDQEWRENVTNLGRVSAPVTLAKRAFAVIEGDVLADVVVPDRATVVVYGNVRSPIQTDGQCEIVIAGDVSEGASIIGADILCLFVGGDLVGRLHNHGACKAWIEGNLQGEVWTGRPSTELRALGDCTAKIRPSEKPSLLYLEVGGFMASASLEATAAVGYTHFSASIARSDRAAGMYPDKSSFEALRQHRSYNRWVIRGIPAQPAVNGQPVVRSGPEHENVC